jgi:hypothetical protein
MPVLKDWRQKKHLQPKAKLTGYRMRTKEEFNQLCKTLELDNRIEDKKEDKIVRKLLELYDI